MEDFEDSGVSEKDWSKIAAELDKFESDMDIDNSKERTARGHNIAREHNYISLKFEPLGIPYNVQTSQLSLFHSETQGFWSILKVIATP